jgi:hypothetical protein
MKPTRAIRYLLCADRTLRRISLRRISVPVKKKISARAKKRSTRPAQSNNSARTKVVSRARWTIEPWMTVLGLTCVIAAAVVIVARQPTPRADFAGLDAQRDPTAPSETGVTAAPVEKTMPLGSASTVAAQASTRSESARTEASNQVKKSAIVEPVKAGPAVQSHLKEPALESKPIIESKVPPPAALEPLPKTDVQDVTSVTITGCLELDEDTYWLKNASGEGAPTSRSWKSGFLKKRKSAVELVDATSALKLRSHVGQRVSATGSLVARELRARTLKQVAASCS